MIIIKLNKDDMPHKSKIKERVEHEILYKPNLAGQDCTIEEGEQTCIEGIAGSYDSASLFLLVCSIINEATGTMEV